MNKIMRIRLLKPVFFLLLLATPLLAQQQTIQPGTDLLSLDTIFRYQPKSLAGIKWLADGSGYSMLEPSPGKNGSLDIVRYDAATGSRTILAPADKLVPPGASSPLMIEAYEFSQDGRKALLFTNSARVWRSNTRGDYWVLDLKSWELRKLGGAAAKPSTLMFAKFSPDGMRVGYVRENNIYVESLADGSIVQLTSDGTRHIINGTFDWVYEEELFCRDGWRWSPDGEQIAYWQLDSEGVKEFQLINDTAALYPVITSFPYPKAGETNSAARVGSVSARGGETRWFDIPGDPRNHYLARMEWAANSAEVIIKQLNRLQNTNMVMLGEIGTGRVRTILTEKDEAWVDVAWGSIGWDKTGLGRGDVEWLDGGKRFLWVSERDGWRHVYSVSRDGKDLKCITPGSYDVIGVEKVNESGGWLYFTASPENATQRYLFRTRLDGAGSAERLSPASEPGSHDYIISDSGDLAIHTYSTFTSPPETEVVRLPQHEKLRVLIDNRELRERLSKIRQGKTKFFRVDIGEGVQLDGWMIEPPDFDPRKRYPVLFHVYGEPWGQTVLDEWDGLRL
ncbi:MAG: DPP IV N-terminal domain-containing protein, partial [Blastocatellia bacterium]|nr:DPP IV N-terminal domain-containing protein [Blastocatellia bacterium]